MLGKYWKAKAGNCGRLDGCSRGSVPLIALVVLFVVLLAFPAVWAAEAARSDASGLAEASFCVSYDSAVTGPDSSLEFVYSDDFFAGSSFRTDRRIARASIGLSTGAYFKDQCRCVLESMGFVNVFQGNYGKRATMAVNDFAAFNVAEKDVVIGGESRHLVVAVVRGTPGDYEWISNFNVGTTGDHAGFFAAAREIEPVIAGYLEDYDASENILWITGHSRGAAVANVLAGMFTTEKNGWFATEHPGLLEAETSGLLAAESSGLPAGESPEVHEAESPRLPAAEKRYYGDYVRAENIYGYCFACPAVSVNADTELRNIHNYCIPGDIVTQVPLEKWGYKRFGVDEEMPGRQRLKRVFERLTGKPYRGFLKKQSVVRSMGWWAPTVKEFYKRKKVRTIGLSRVMTKHDLLNAIAVFLVADRDAADEKFALEYLGDALRGFGIRLPWEVVVSYLKCIIVQNNISFLVDLTDGRPAMADGMSYSHSPEIYYAWLCA